MSSSLPYNVTGTSATNTYSEEKLQKQLVVLIEPLSKSVIEKFTKPKVNTYYEMSVIIVVYRQELLLIRTKKKKIKKAS